MIKNADQLTDLRQRAEEEVREQPTLPDNLNDLTLEKAQRLIHELRVYQVELELQNEELRKTRQELEASNEKYCDFYNIAPVAYLALSDKELIIEANLTAARFFGVARSAVINQKLSRFIAFEDQDVFYLQFQQMLRGSDSLTWDMRMSRSDGDTFWVNAQATSHKESEEGSTTFRIVLSDISERKQIEEKLLESETFLLDTGRIAKVGGWELDSQTLEVRWTDVTYSIHELPVGEKPSFEDAINFFHPEDRPKLSAAIKQSIDHGDPYDMEIRLVTAKGNHLWTRTNCSPVMADGKVVKLKGIFQDITERKRVQDALEENEDRLSQVLQGSQLGYWDWNLETGEVKRNARWAEMLGYTLQDVNLTVKQWEDFLHPEDRERALRSINDHLEGRSPLHRAEYRMQTKEGQHRWILDQAMVVKHDAAGKPLRMSGTHTDITELKNVEKELQLTSGFLESLINYANAPIIVWDPDLRITRFNQAFERLTGLPAKDVIGKSLGVLFPEGQRNQLLEFIRRTSLVGERWETVEIPILQTSGAVRTVLWNCAGILDQDGKIIVATIAQGQDITERKQAEEALRESEEQFDLFMKYCPVHVFFKDENLRGIRLSNSFESLLGRPLNELLGKNVHDLFPPELARNMIDDDMEVLRKGVSITVEECFDDKTYVTTKFPINREGKPPILAGFALDITERKLAETALHREQKMLSRTEAIAHVGSWEWGVASDTVEWSEELFRIFQIDPASGAPTFAQHHQLYNLEDMERLQSAIDAALSEGKPYELELRAIRSDGEIRYCLASGYPETGPDGVVAHLFGTLQDITDRVAAERARLAAEVKYRAIFENAPVGIYQSTSEGKYLSVNGELARILGYDSPEDLLSHVTDIGRDVYVEPEQRYALNAILDQKGAVENYEALCKRKDGSTIWTARTVRLATDPSGRPGCHDGFLHDINERKRGEEALLESQAIARTLHNASDDLVLLLDNNGIILDANQMAMSLLGLKGKKAEGRSAWDVLPLDMAVRCKTFFYKALDFRG